MTFTQEDLDLIQGYIDDQGDFSRTSEMRRRLVSLKERVQEIKEREERESLAGAP